MRRLILICVVAFAACALFPATGTASPHSGANAPKHKFGRGTSTNWSGYAVDGTGATQVTGTWTQPSASCSSKESSWSSPWVGIDGNNSGTVEQIGTDTDCSNGRPYYYAWYEMYPKPLVLINSMPIRAGDSFTGSVTYSGSGFTMTLTNNSVPAGTSGRVFQTTQVSKKAQRTSVEWVMEGPSSGLLTNFGTVGFSSATARFSNQATSQSLGSFGSRQAITMVTPQGTPRAVPSSVASGASAFSVAWKHG